MDSNATLHLLDTVAAESGKIAKVSLLAAHADSQLLRCAVEAAYNPFKRFGVLNVPVKQSGGEATLGESHWQLLEALASRALSGNAARSAVQAAMDELAAPSAELLKRILTKDLRAGFSESTANKVWPGLVPTFPYMRCSLQSDVDLTVWPWERGIYSQEKADGMFVNCDVLAGGVEMTTRQGSVVPVEQLGALGGQLLTLLEAGYQYHGEMLVQERAGAEWMTLPRQEGNGALNSALQGGVLSPKQRVVYLIWDCVPLDAIKPKGSHAAPYSERLAQLQALVGAAAALDTDCQLGLVPMRDVYSLEEAAAHYLEMLGAGKEGTVLKHPDGPWRDGTSVWQVKYKLAFEVDLKITGYNPGKGKHANSVGSLICSSSDDELVVSVNLRSDAQRADVNARRAELLESVVTLKANDLNKPSKSNPRWSLFLPVLLELRLDKTVADDLPRIQRQYSDTVAGRARAAASDQTKAA